MLDTHAEALSLKPETAKETKTSKTPQDVPKTTLTMYTTRFLCGTLQWYQMTAEARWHTLVNFAQKPTHRSKT
eukprot:5842642-Amphidinium_carterae.1